MTCEKCKDRTVTPALISDMRWRLIHNVERTIESKQATCQLYIWLINAGIIK